MKKIFRSDELCVRLNPDGYEQPHQKKNLLADSLQCDFTADFDLPAHTFQVESFLSLVPGEAAILEIECDHPAPEASHS